MKEWLVAVTEPTIVIIDAIALLVVVIGTAEALFRGLPVMFSGSKEEQRGVWLRYAQWLVAGLTFQLASDVIESSITTSWDAVARLAAVAVIRTLLNYFLERDTEVREQECGAPTMSAAPRLPGPAE